MLEGARAAPHARASRWWQVTGTGRETGVGKVK